MRRAPLTVLVVLLAVAGGGCASGHKETAPAPLLDRRAEAKDGASAGSEQHVLKDQPTDQSLTQPTKIEGDPGHNRPPESRQADVPAERERGVALPDSLEVAAAPSFPEHPRIAVAFVRGGKLVRRADALRRLAHDLERDARIEGLERFDDGAPSQLDLDALCARAAKQGALLLLVDARAKDDDPDRTTLVLSTAAPHRAYAFTRPKATAPAGQELVARLVRTSRT